ncbi:MAG: hypothetical protein IH940_10270 [Acidobacteria bacterium]|nr:hypothetical protein [Acidobacteriota bacterium]
MMVDPGDDTDAHPVTWWPIETITIATARLGSINENLAALCSGLLERSLVDAASLAMPVAAAEHMFGGHGAQWVAVVPESARLEKQRAPRPMPEMFEELRQSDAPDFEQLISALYDATRRLAMGVDNPEGRPFLSICETVLFDLKTLVDTASASRSGTFVDKLSVFTLQ